MPRRSNPQRFVALDDLAARWMKHDPAGALAFLAGLTDFERRRAGQAALLAWFERDPAGVQAFMKTMVRRDESVADYLQPIFERMAFDGATLRLNRLGGVSEGIAGVGPGLRSSGHGAHGHRLP